MAEIPNLLKWKRPESVEFPKVWHTFKARDVDSDELVEYRIQDAPQSRAEEIYQFMGEYYIKDEPMGQVLGGGSDKTYYEDYKMTWISMIKQKMPVVCFRAGSDEIVGVNMLFVVSKEDNFMVETYKHYKGDVMKDVFGMINLLYDNFDPFERYNVNEHLASFGLSVSRKYRGRAIGDHFMEARKLICKTFGLKISHTIFSSDFSNKNADVAGFQLDVAMTFDEIMKKNPKLKIKGIKSRALTLKTLIIK